MNDIMPQVYEKYSKLEEKYLDKIIKDGLRKITKEMRRGEEFHVGTGSDSVFMIFRRFPDEEMRDRIMRKNLRNRRIRRRIEKRTIAKKEREQNAETSS